MKSVNDSIVIFKISWSGYVLLSNKSNDILCITSYILRWYNDENGTKITIIQCIHQAEYFQIQVELSCQR